MKHILIACLASATLAGCSATGPTEDNTKTTTTTPPHTMSTLTAKDGNNIDACTDGNCEVLVDLLTEIPINPAKADKHTSKVQVSDISGNWVTVRCLIDDEWVVLGDIIGNELTTETGLHVEIAATEGNEALVKISTK